MSIWVLMSFSLWRLLPLFITVLGLAMWRIFTTNVDAENQTLIYHKCVCGELKRHFCQTRVSGCSSVRPIFFSLTFLMARSYIF